MFFVKVVLCFFFYIIVSFCEKEMILRIKKSLVFKFEMYVRYFIVFKKD